MTRIIHFSDSHYPAVLNCRSCRDKRFIGSLNSLLIRRAVYNQDSLKSLIAYILEQKPDVAVFTGDAVSTSQPEEFEKALELFRPLIQSGIPLIYTPGNHDCYVKDPVCRQAMEEFYGKLTGRRYTPEPVLHRIAGLRFAEIHCARPTSILMSCGSMDSGTEEFLREQVVSTDPEPLICVGHFPLYPEKGIKGMRRKLYGAEDILRMLKKRKIALSLCGHIHHGYEIRNAGVYSEICAGSIAKHGTFAELEYDPDTRIFTCTRRNTDRGN